MSKNKAAVITQENLHDYFRVQLYSALARRDVELGDYTIIYLVNLLGSFTDPRHLFERTETGYELKPLAFQLMDALNAEGIEQRNLALRKMGDIALFVAGLFSGSLRRQLVDIDYYIAMGGSAYNSLHQHLEQSSVDVSQAVLFGELAEKFAGLVDVLAEISEASHLGSNNDLLRLYDVWINTGSDYAYRRLLRQGVQPDHNAISRSQH